jgi:ubiquinone/menaquinone biosynthesis C-methylase UbiE
LSIDKDSIYLDVGCGSGLAASFAANLGAHVTGVDAAENLIEIAKERAPSGVFQVADIEELPFDDNTFSCITGYNSFQYAGNPSVALGEAKRVAAPGAYIIVMTWGEPEGMEAANLVAALKPLLPTPPPNAPGPFALSEETLLKSFASDAGLKPIEVFDVSSPWIYPNLETAMRGLCSSGVAAKAITNTSLDEVNQAHKEALAPFVKMDGSYEIGASFRCLISTV